MAIVAVSIAPVGAGVSVSKYVARAVEVLEAADLEYELGSAPPPPRPRRWLQQLTSLSSPDTGKGVGEFINPPYRDGLESRLPRLAGILLMGVADGETRKTVLGDRCNGRPMRPGIHSLQADRYHTAVRRDETCYRILNPR